MEILLTIDKFLQNVFVRWALLVATVAALATATWAKIQLGTVRLQRDAAQGQNATYKAHIEVQNAAVRQLMADTDQAKGRIAEAKQKAGKLKEELDKWRSKPPVFKGTCDEMVQQALAEVRK